MKAATLKDYSTKLMDLAREMQEQSWLGETCAEEDMAGDQAVKLTEELAVKLGSMAARAAAVAKTSTFSR